MRRRVVVTGLGCVTPVGNDVGSTWQALLDGKSGGAPITHFDTTHHKVRFACEVKGFDPALYMDRKEIKRSDLYTQYAVAAATQAMTDAGLGDGTGYDAFRTGVVIASGIGGINTFEEQHEVLLKSGPGRISAFFIPMFISDIASGVVSMRFQAKGPNFCTVSACASSGHGIGISFRSIQYGDADIMIAGGAEASVTAMSMAGFANMQALSTRNDDPARASRPFDATRDGFVLGEGSGVVILEELEHARARGARIYGEVAGFGMTGDAYHLTGQPEDHEGLQRAMRRALEDGGISPAELHYVNAHGTSTPLNDPNEIRAIKAVLGPHASAVNVSSTKSSTGHMLGAAGAAETIFSTLAIYHGVVPPTINLQSPDPECDLDCTANVPVKRPVSAVLNNSSGFGGHNTSLALTRFRD
ncbi:MAG: beta-ketoacyl-[acyl-carrier-protein] synthase II [Gemmatimonas sp.]|nr:beta-ketoacyl-[acyl-carrier-protein] synthase II [Gemmatimonas sp.]